LFTKHVKNDILIIHIYVDDVIFGSTNELLCKKFEQCMKNEFEMSMMGEFNYFLGLQIKQKNSEICLNQAKYTNLLIYSINYSTLTNLSYIWGELNMHIELRSFIDSQYTILYVFGGFS